MASVLGPVCVLLHGAWLLRCLAVITSVLPDLERRTKSPCEVVSCLTVGVKDGWSCTVAQLAGSGGCVKVIVEGGVASRGVNGL